MPDFLKRFDGTGRTPRPVQTDALQWLSVNWETSSAFAISAPVAAGKSALAKAISVATGAHIITPTNLLVDQYHDIYPTMNFLKGKQHYTCSPQMSCYEWVNECEQPACNGCPYVAAKDRAAYQPTFFNPMSYWYFTMTEGFEPPEVLVVDEAHTLASSLLLLCGVRIRKSEYQFPKDTNDELTLIRWLDNIIENLNKLRKLNEANRSKTAEITQEIAKLRLTCNGLKENPQNYAIWTEKGMWRRKKETFLNIKPLSVPQYITKRFFSARKVVLLSGTIMETDVKELLGGRKVLFKDLPSPIPPSSRPIQYTPVPFRMNWETPPAGIARSIEDVVRRHPGQNTIIHVSYDLSAKLLPHFTIPIISNNPENKDEKLAEFKSKGGVFLAAGCAEGIDLKGDLARVNIIPKLLYPNLKDPVVIKRKALADGAQWFALVTLRTVIQQAGRSTRDTDDHSTTYILDPSFSAVYHRWKRFLPTYFIESLQWLTSPPVRWSTSSSPSAAAAGKQATT